MPLKIFIAGATGVIGRSLVPLLKNAGHAIVGTTRTPRGVAALESAGIGAVRVDVFDRTQLEKAVMDSAPDVIVHQLTDLSAGLNSNNQAEVIAGNARLRREGTANLVAAA